MYQKLEGSLNNHAHLFKLVQLLTYFTLRRREKDPEITTKDILIKWLDSSDGDSLRLTIGIDSFINTLNDITMPFVVTYMYGSGLTIELFGLTSPAEMRREILYIINEYWLPF